jgi:hypothetical protein
MVQNRASTLLVPHSINQLVLNHPENLKFREVRPIQPTDTSGSGKVLFSHPISTQVQNTAQKSCNIGCNKKT